jgi:hypothetical protein
MHALTRPMIDDRELDEGDGQLLHHDVLEDAHQRQFIAGFEAHVVAEDRVSELDFCGLFF